MTGEYRQATDVLEQGTGSRTNSGTPRSAVAIVIVVALALVSGLAWWSQRADGSDQSTTSTRPMLASPLVVNRSSVDSDGTTTRLTVDVTNVDVHTMRIHEIHLTDAPGVTTEWVGLATDREVRYVSAEGFTPHPLDRGSKLPSNESTHLVALMHINCAELAASQPTSIPTFQIDYTASGFRRTQYLEQNLDMDPSPSPGEAWGCRPAA